MRLIGVGEILRRVAGKVVMPVLREDVVTSVGSLQVCNGHDPGCEATIHAMHFIFSEENAAAVLFIDAGNAFNMVNKKVFLHNITMICPAISTYVFNFYARPSRLFDFGEYQVSSVEGTTRGNPTDVPLYAVVSLLLMVLEIMSIFHENTIKMASYADSFTAGGVLRI